MKDEYWYELKCRISGLRLLVYHAAENAKNRATILERWFQDNDEIEDKLYADIKKIAAVGIRLGNAPGEILDGMINAVPTEEINKPDIARCTFRPFHPDKFFEQIYNEELHKYRFVKVYEGLLPSREYDGQSFADLAFRHKPSDAIRSLEDVIGNESIITWARVLSQISDRDVSILSTGMSRTGRFLLLGGLSDERVHDVVKEAILSGSVPHKDADRIAEMICHAVAGGFRDRIRK